MVQIDCLCGAGKIFPYNIVIILSLILSLSSSYDSRYIGQQLDARGENPLQCVQPLPM